MDPLAFEQIPLRVCEITHFDIALESYMGNDSSMLISLLTAGPIEGTEGFDRLVPKEGSSNVANPASRIPTQRFGTKDDIANATVFLFSPAGSYVRSLYKGSAMRCSVSGLTLFTYPALRRSPARKL